MTQNEVLVLLRERGDCEREKLIRELSETTHRACIIKNIRTLKNRWNAIEEVVRDGIIYLRINNLNGEG